MQFKSKVMSAAVAVALGVAGSAHAAFLSETGHGQALIFPYYTVNGGFDTYLTVTNTTSIAKAVKVRIIEGKNSREVLDFNLYLSQYDSWLAAITTTTDGGNGRIIAFDKSCTAPPIPASGQAFRNAQYAGVDLAEATLDRAREGYIEVLEMGAFTQASNPSLWNAITHVSGTPANCASAVAQSSTPATLLNPTGGLYGIGSLINVTKGDDVAYDAVAIDAYRIPTGGSATNASIHTGPGSLSPSLSDASVISTVIGVDAAGAQHTISSVWGAGYQAISAVLLRSNVYNDYIVDPALGAGTDFVVTFPTKRFWYTSGSPSTTFVPVVSGSYGNPFTSSFASANGACEPVGFAVYDREETGLTNVDFSPSNTYALCWEANVITVGSSSPKVLGSVKLSNTLSAYNQGWVNIDLSSGHSMFSASSAVDGGTTTTATYNGLPVVGFAVQQYGVGGLYLSGKSVHKYNRNITTTAGGSYR